MCDADLDPCEAYRSRWRLARKKHRCLACAETITTGHRYRYTSGVFDGAGFDMKHCARCWLLLSVIGETSGRSPDAELDCGETWEGAFGEPPPPHVTALAFITPDEAQAIVRSEAER